LLTENATLAELEMPQTYLITGAGSGLGRDLAGHFASGGHRVLVTDCSLPAAEETCRLAGSKANVSAHRLDVTSEQDLDDLVGESSGAIDVAVCNAGLQHVSRIEEFAATDWERLVEVMLCGTARITRRVLPAMIEQGFGRLVYIGSIHSLVASPYKSAYVAAKHGLLGLAKSIALETAAADITVNTICPSYIRTPLVEQQIAAQAREHGISEEEVIEQVMLAPMPKKAFITSAEVAATIEFLVNPAARNITGQTIVIDGGWTCR